MADPHIATAGDLQRVRPAAGEAPAEERVLRLEADEPHDRVVGAVIDYHHVARPIVEPEQRDLLREERERRRPVQ